MLLQHAVILTYIDGEQSDAEVKVLEELTQKLNLPADEAQLLRDTAETRAKRLLDLL